MSNEADDDFVDYSAEIRALQAQINEKTIELNKKKEDYDKLAKAHATLGAVSASLGGVNLGNVSASIQAGLQGEQGRKFCDEVASCGVDFGGVTASISSAMSQIGSKRDSLFYAIKNLEKEIEALEDQIASLESMMMK